MYEMFIVLTSGTYAKKPLFPRCSRWSALARPGDRAGIRASPRSPAGAARLRAKKLTGNAGPARDNGGVVAGITREATAAHTVQVRLLGEFAVTAGGRSAGP